MDSSRDGSGVSWPNVLRDDLIDGWAHPDVFPFRMNSAQKHGGRSGVIGARVGTRSASGRMRQI